MKIGLIGAPGSGKTEVAHALAVMLDPRFPPTRIIDHYIDEVEEETDIGCTLMGASFVGDIAVCIKRFGQERCAVRDGASATITCGTMLDSATYTALRCTIDANQANWQVANVMMTWYSMMGFILLDYDHLFYLPVGDYKDQVQEAIDQNLKVALDTLGHHYQVISSAADAYTFTV